MYVYRKNSKISHWKSKKMRFDFYSNFTFQFYICQVNWSSQLKSITFLLLFCLAGAPKNGLTSCWPTFVPSAKTRIRGCQHLWPISRPRRIPPPAQALCLFTRRPTNCCSLRRRPPLADLPVFPRRPLFRVDSFRTRSRTRLWIWLDPIFPTQIYANSIF